MQAVQKKKYAGKSSSYVKINVKTRKVVSIKM